MLFICCMLFSAPILSNDYTDFSNTLGWEKKWNKVVSNATEKYLSRLEEGPFSKLSIENKNLAVSEMRKSLNNQLNWDVMGKDFTQGMIKHCDPTILNTMIRIYKKEQVLNVEKEKVATEYSSCATKGFMESFEKLQGIIMASNAETDLILKKYQ